MSTFDLIKLATLENRRNIVIDDEVIVDLTESVIDFTKPLTYSHPPILITKELAGRPWLVSKLVYGSEEHYDLLCIFNSIPLPIMLEEGMVLVCPDLDSMRANLKDNTKDPNTNQSKQAFTNKLSKKDQDRISQAVVQNGGTKGDIRTPNMVKDGTKAVTAAGGQIILGTNISDSRCKTELSSTQSVTEQIRKALKIRLTKNSEIQNGTSSKL